MGEFAVKRKQAVGKEFEGYVAVVFESARVFRDFSKAAYSSHTNIGVTRQGVSAVRRRRKNNKNRRKNDEQH